MSLQEKELISVKNSLNNKFFEREIEHPKVSVIVPFYNTEKFIARCLFSLISQTEKEIEIICVNDASEDDTQKIVSLFAEHDSRIKIIRQEHKLQGAARNNGIRHAKGEYIGFVDSDDWVDLDYYEKLYIAAKKYNSDLALAVNVRIGNGKTKKRLNIKAEEFVKDLQGKFDICHLWKDACPTNKIYRKSFLEYNNILFPEGVYCEDKFNYYKNFFQKIKDDYYNNETIYNEMEKFFANSIINTSTYDEYLKNYNKIVTMGFLRRGKNVE